MPLSAPRSLDPALIEGVRNFSERCGSSALDLPDDRQDVGCVLIGSGFVCYSSGLVRGLTGLRELRVPKGDAPGLGRSQCRFRPHAD